MGDTALSDGTRLSILREAMKVLGLTSDPTLLPPAITALLRYKGALRTRVTELEREQDEARQLLAEARGLLLRVHHRIAGTAGTDAPCTAADVEELAAHLTAAGLIGETKKEERT